MTFCHPYCLPPGNCAEFQRFCFILMYPSIPCEMKIQFNHRIILPLNFFLEYFNCYSKHAIYICNLCIVHVYMFDLNVVHRTSHSVSENHHRNYGIHILKGFSRITCKLCEYQNPLNIHPHILYYIIHDQRLSIRTMCDMVCLSISTLTC